jgi:succinyl-diaminopimelate desuccinylase
METPTRFDDLRTHLASLREVAIDYQRRLTAIPALAPKLGGEGEARKATCVMEILRDLGVSDVTEHRAEDPEEPCGYRPSVIARIPGRRSDRTLWIMAHLDIVDPGKREEWKSDPYTLRIDGDRLYGRGVEDNQQGVVGALLLARALRETGIVPPIDLGLLFIADEETGSHLGIEHVLAHRTLFGPDDLIIVPDGGVEDGSMIEVAEKGILWVEFTVKGKQCHGSTPDKGVNAHRAAAHLAVALDRLYERFPASSPLFDPPTSTFEPTRRQKNVDSVNVIPGEDVFAVDCRLMPEYALDDVLAAMDEICREVEVRCSRGSDLRCVISRTVLQRADAAPATDPAAPVVQRLAAAVKQVYGVTGKPMGIGGGTVAAFIRRQGFPAAVWCRLDETLHQPNEYCLLSNLIGDAQVFAFVLLCG